MQATSTGRTSCWTAEPTLAPSECEQPAWGPRTAAALLTWGLAWGLLLWAVREVPVDSAEQLAWVRSLQWGYYKHPPLPTWLMAPWVLLFGLQEWIPLLLGVSTKLLSLFLCWDLLRRMDGPRRATLALVCIAGVAYYSSRLHIYSHNEVMLLASASAAWSLWRAWQEALLRYWVLLGVCLGLGVLAKYQAVTTVASAVLFCLLAGVTRQPRQGLGLCVALAVAALILVPHVLWLVGQPHTPLNYAAQSSLDAAWDGHERLRQLLDWVGDLMVRCAGALMLLGGLWWWARRSRSASLAAYPWPPEETHVAPWRQAKLLLWCWALVPVAFVLVMGLLGGATVRPQWATPMALWLVAALFMDLPEVAVRKLPLARFIGLAAAVQAMLVSHLLWSEHQAQSADARWGQPMVQRWARSVAEAARLELGGEIRVVIAPETVASTFALAVPERPYPVLDGRLEISPWVPHGLIERCGALFIVYEPPGPGRHAVVGGPPDLVWRAVPPAEPGGCVGDRKTQ